jgi:NitT/TauT family transport system permease protein
VAHLESAGTGSTPTTANAANNAELNVWRTPHFPRIERWLPATVILGGLALWEIAARADWISRLFFPPPSAILLTLVHMAATSALWMALGMTLYRLVAGILIGGSAGALLGWLMGASRPLRVALDPIVAALHPLPKLAIFPIFLILLGIGEASKVALLATVAFFPMLINTLAGVQQIDHVYWEVAANYGATGRAFLRRVILPGSLPMALTGLRLAVNSARLAALAVDSLDGAAPGAGVGAPVRHASILADHAFSPGPDVGSPPVGRRVLVAGPMAGSYPTAAARRSAEQIHHKRFGDATVAAAWRWNRQPRCTSADDRNEHRCPSR